MLVLFASRACTASAAATEAALFAAGGLRAFGAALPGCLQQRDRVYTVACGKCGRQAGE